MSLPFLANAKKRMQPGIIVEHRQPDQPEAEENHGLMAASRDLIDAVHNRDEKGVMAALQAAFDLMEADEDRGEIEDSAIGPSEG